jgi:hypothetical protein
MGLKDLAVDLMGSVVSLGIPLYRVYSVFACCSPR